MKPERILDRIENFIEFNVGSLNEGLFYRKPESVGTMRVARVLKDDLNPDFDMLYLDFGGNQVDDQSSTIRHVPKGLVREEAIVEIFVRKRRIPANPESWLTSFRPFNKALKGRPFMWDEEDLAKIFAYNAKDSLTSRGFYLRFI